jgi:hypothetical protein
LFQPPYGIVKLTECLAESGEALVHGSELRTDPPVPRAGLTPLGSCQASRDWSSC